MKISQKSSEIILSDNFYKKSSEIERSYKIYLRNLIPNEKKLKILDIGSGTGLNASILKKRGHDLTCIDFSKEAIKKIKLKGFKAHLMNIEDGKRFKEKTFDVLFCSEVIEHLEDTDFFFKEAHRVLKKGGSLYLSTPNSSFWVFRIYSLFGKTLSEVQHDGHLRFFSKKSLLSFVKKSKFKLDFFFSRIIFIICPFDINFLKFFGFKKEKRFKTNSFFWYLGFCCKYSSNFFSDDFIIKLKK